MSNGFDFTYFINLIYIIRNGNNSVRLKEIPNLLCCDGLNCHIKNNDTGRGVYSINEVFEYTHEFNTAVSLTNFGYDVVFVPDGFFARGQKKFDVFLCKDHIMFECDLKCITSTNPDTIGKRIKNGSEQANRLVIDIQSGIGKKELIDGLKIGCERNGLIKEIMLVYKSRFYRLFPTQILSKNIYDVIK